MKDIHHTISVYHYTDFIVPSYQTFVRRAQQALPQMVGLLKQLLSDTAAIRLMDATMLPVSKPHRADRHKVAKNMLNLEKTGKGGTMGLSCM